MSMYLSQRQLRESVIKAVTSALSLMEEALTLEGA